LDSLKTKQHTTVGTPDGRASLPVSNSSAFLRVLLPLQTLRDSVLVLLAEGSWRTMQRLAGRLGHALADGTSCAWAHDAALASPAGDVGTGPRTADCCRDAGGPGPHAEHLRSHQLADRALARAAEADGGTAATAGAPAAPLAARALEVPYAGVFLRATQAGERNSSAGQRPGRGRGTSQRGWPRQMRHRLPGGHVFP